MTPFWIILAIVAGVALLVLVIAYICFRISCYDPRKPRKDKYPLPQGEIYKPYHDQMIRWIEQTRAMPHEDMQIKSFDGLTLRAKYYEFAPGAPIELMFHGYRGCAEGDLCGGVQRCFQLGRSCLIVDQRCSGQSGGHVISFGINEHRDCLAWVDHAVKCFGPDVKIILTGISMGASTVLMTADKNLPENFIGILVDCGFTSAKEIIRKVIRQMGLPPTVCYPLVRLAARIFGRFDLEAHSALEAMKQARVPVIFFHGEKDDFVPCEMSRRIYDVYQGPKTIFTVPDAGHGMAYLLDIEGYVRVHKAFFGTPEAPATYERSETI